MKRLAILLGVSLLLVGDLRAQAPLEVVRTFGDLAAQPTLTLSDGTRVRVGVESQRVPAQSVLLVYALLEGAAWLPAFDHPLGPLEVEIARGKTEARTRPIRALAKIKAPRGPVFLATCVCVDEPGTYELALRDARGEVVARAALEVTAQTPHPWLVFTGQQEEPGEEPREVDASSHFLALTPSWRGQPRVHGNEPIPTPRDDVNGISSKEPLPRSHWQVDPRLALTATPTSLELTFKIPLDVVRSSEQLLARVWVNQKPFVPPAAGKDALRAAAKQAAHREGKVHIALEFNPALFGAKKGDRISIQLLYCPDGVVLVPPRKTDREQAKTVAEAEAAPRLPLATPKAEFIVP